jgi:hypothetical protein
VLLIEKLLVLSCVVSERPKVQVLLGSLAVTLVFVS